jgi:hypothetical protein
LTSGTLKPETELLRLLDALAGAMVKSKRVKDDEVPHSLIYELLNMTLNSRSKVFSGSADWLDPKLADNLMEQGLIQKVMSGADEGGKFALTFRGIARCIHIKYGKTFEEQFVGFLERTDRKFNTTEQVGFLWNEKLACLSMVLLASTSPSAAIRLNIEANKNMLTEVFQKTLACLKIHGLVDKDAELKTVSRGESVSSALMSRLYTLPRKTNHYYKYIGKGSEYFLDIQRDDDVDEKRLFFLLRRIFENYIPACDYGRLYKELAQVSQLYYPRFRSRSVSPKIVLSVLKKLKDFTDREVMNLPFIH